MVRDLNIKNKLNFLEKNIGENFQNLGLGEEFLEMTLKKHDHKIKNWLIGLKTNQFFD